MRHFVLVAIAALAIAIALVLVIGEEEAGEDTTPVTVTTEKAPATPPATTPPAPPKRAGSGEAADVERAVEAYVEAVETGEVQAPPGDGVLLLPTTDELSIRSVEIAGNRATARLAGGERLLLRRSGGRWRVKRVLSVR
jgi:hypothetical protein